MQVDLKPSELVQYIQTTLISKHCVWENLEVHPKLQSHNTCSYCHGRTPPGVITEWSIPLKMVPFSDEYDLLDEPEVLLYHGTSFESMVDILSGGFSAESSLDPSFGNGVYFTPCPRLAQCFGDRDCILLCKVKPGRIRWFSQYLKKTEDHQKSPLHDSHVLQDLTEYVIFDSKRMIPLKLINTSYPSYKRSNSPEVSN